MTKEQAQDALRKAEMDILNEKNGLPTTRIGDIVLEDLMKAYREARRARASAKYINQAEWEMRRLFTAQKIRLLRQLTPDTVDAYLGKRMSEGVSATTANAALVCLRPKKDGSFKEVDAEVRKQWIDEGRNNVLVYRMMVETGLRRNECRSIT